jgi:hypothetical protein
VSKPEQPAGVAFADPDPLRQDRDRLGEIEAGAQ